MIRSLLGIKTAGQAKVADLHSQLAKHPTPAKTQVEVPARPEGAIDRGSLQRPTFEDLNAGRKR